MLSKVCCPGETCSDDALFEVPCGENDLDGAICEFPRCDDDMDGALFEVSCSEDDLNGALSEADSNGKQIMVLGQPAQSALGTARVSARSSGAGDLARARWQRADVLRSGGAPPLGRRAMRRFRQARGERARCESHVARSHRVNVTLHENLLFTPPACRTARNTQNSFARDTGVHDAMQRTIRLGRNSGNSSNSLGDTEGGGLHFCVPGRTKSLSTSTRCGVRRSAVNELAHAQQASLKLHEETWACLLQKPGLKISQEVEIILGCAVTVTYPSCSFELSCVTWARQSYSEHVGLVTDGENR